MSVTSVQNKIKTAMQDSFVTKVEAEAIVKEAEKNGVTAREGMAVADLFERQAVAPPPGTMVTMAIPEFPGQVTFEAGAAPVLQAFFDRNSIPAGADREAVRARLQLSLENTDLGMALAKKPYTGRLFELSVQKGFINPDFPIETAFIDLKKEQFFLKVEGGFTRDPSAKFYGPFMLKQARPLAVAAGG